MSSSDSVWNSGGESSDSQCAQGEQMMVPEAPVEAWRSALENKTLTSKDLIDYFKLATPFLFLLESAQNPADLGECCNNGNRRNDSEST